MTQQTARRLFTRNSKHRPTSIFPVCDQLKRGDSKTNIISRGQRGAASDGTMVIFLMSCRLVPLPAMRMELWRRFCVSSWVRSASDRTEREACQPSPEATRIPHSFTRGKVPPGAAGLWLNISNGCDHAIGPSSQCYCCNLKPENGQTTSIAAADRAHSLQLLIPKSTH